MRSFIAVLLALGTSLLANVGHAEVSSYLIPIVRADKALTMVAYNFWSSEYPDPVINVNAGKKGSTTIQAFESLRTLDKPVSCTIENEIYHPWGKSPSLVSWYSIVPQSSYKAKKDTEVKYDGDKGEVTVPLKAGDTLEREVYLSEGYCNIAVPVNGKMLDVSMSCSNVADNKDLEHIVGVGESEQWMQVQCAEGVKAFVQDGALLAHPGITEGQITGYGSVGP